MIFVTKLSGALVTVALRCVLFCLHLQHSLSCCLLVLVHYIRISLVFLSTLTRTLCARESRSSFFARLFTSTRFFCFVFVLSHFSR